LQVGRVERNEDNEEGYEPRFQGFVGEDTRGNIVRHTGYRFECDLDGGEWKCNFIPKLLLRCGLLAWTRFRLILKKAGALSGLEGWSRDCHPDSGRAEQPEN